MALIKQLYRENGVPVLWLEGSLVGEDCRSVHHMAMNCCSSDRRGLAINLTHVNSIDNKGRETLVEILAECLKFGVPLALIGESEHCRILLGSDLLNNAFSSYPSVSEAVAHVPLLSKIGTVLPESVFPAQPSSGALRSEEQIAPSRPSGQQVAANGVSHASLWAQKKTAAQSVGFERYIGPKALLEVMHPVWGSRPVTVSKSPFFIGRGGDNDLLLLDERISRKCAVLLYSEDRFYIEDCGNQTGLCVNGDKISRKEVCEDDIIGFSLPQSYSLRFHLRTDQQPMDLLVSKLEAAGDLEPHTRSLSQLSLLLEAAALMQSQLPVNDVLKAVLDRAVELTGADRGVLYDTKKEGDLYPFLARQHGAQPLEPDNVHFSPQVRRSLDRALQEHKSITETVTLPGPNIKLSEHGSAAPEMSWTVIPLLMPGQPRTLISDGQKAHQDVLGLLYLDSLNPLTFSCTDRVLDALAVQAASVMANAHLVQKEFERQQLLQEMNIARRIQQALLPKGFKEYPYLQVTGVSKSCSAVGGDYFDFIDIGVEQTAFIVADVSGHGLGAALLTTMLQGIFTAMALGPKPSNVFQNTNRFICEHAEVGRHATLFFGLIAPDGKLEYINAGHWPPLLIRANHVETVFPATCLPIGLFPKVEFVSMSDRLLPGDTLIVYTDGIIEANDKQENEFGMARLQEAITPGIGSSVEDLQDSILTSLHRFTSGASQADDITLLILRYTGC